MVRGHRFVQHVVAPLQHLHFQLDVLLPHGSLQQFHIARVHLGVENIFRYQKRVGDVAGEAADIRHGLQQFVTDAPQHVNVFEICLVVNDVVRLVDGVVQEVIVIPQLQILAYMFELRLIFVPQV